MASVRQPPSS